MQSQRPEPTRGDQPTRACAVPAPPTNIDDINLSQAFRGACTSLQSSADFSGSDLGRDAGRSAPSGSVDDDGPPPRAAAVFKVPYRNSRPVATAARQGALNVVGGLRPNQHQRDAKTYTENAADGVGLTDGNLERDFIRDASEDHSDTTGSQFQSSFGGVPGSPSMCPLDSFSSFEAAATNQRDHVGDTPLALSGSESALIVIIRQFVKRPYTWAGADWAASLPGPVGPVSRWAATSNVEVGQTTYYPVNRGRAGREGREGSEGQSHKDQDR